MRIVPRFPFSGAVVHGGLLLCLLAIAGGLAAEDKLPDTVVRALSTHEKAVAKARADLAALQAKCDATVLASRSKCIQEAKRVAGSSKDPAVQTACWRTVLRLDEQDAGARSYFTAQGTLQDELRGATDLLGDLAQVAGGASAGTAVCEAWAALDQAGRAKLIEELNAVIDRANPAGSSNGRISSDGARIDLSGLNVPSFAPFARLPLRVVVLNGVKGLEDVRPLADLPINELYLSDVQVTDLTPLANLPLQRLEISNNRRITDLSPLRRLRLTFLNANGSPLLADLSPLAGMPLGELNLAGTRVASLAALAGTPLTMLTISNCTALTSLNGLEGLPLRILTMNDMPQITALDPLQRCPLGELYWSRSPLKNLDGFGPLMLQRLGLSSSTALRSLKGLERQPLQYLDLTGCSLVADLSPLVGRPLRELYLENTMVESLAPVATSPIETLNVSGTRLTNLADLQQMPLKNLWMCRLGQVKMIAPIAKLPLNSLYVSGTNLRDHALISQIRSLTACDLQGWQPSQ